MLALYESRWLLLVGMETTIRVFILSTVLAGVLAFILGLARASARSPIRIAATCWIEFFRGISTVVLLFWLYFALPFLGISLSAEVAAVLGLGVVHGAYNAEVVRGAVQSIGAGQREASAALGLSRWQALIMVILPQALVQMLPPFGNGLVLLLKGTSIASLITVAELTTQSNLVVTRTMAIFPIFLCVLSIYYVIAVSVVAGMRGLERRLTHWRRIGSARAG